MTSAAQTRFRDTIPVGEQRAFADWMQYFVGLDSLNVNELLSSSVRHRRLFLATAALYNDWHRWKQSPWL